MYVSHTHTVEKREIACHTKRFYVKSIFIVTLISRKFTLTHFWQKFREINSFSKEVNKELIS